MKADHAKAYVLGRIKAFKYVFRGMGWMLAREASLQVQFVLFILSGILSWKLEFNRVEWVLFALLWGLILTAETLNTAVEKLSDVVSPDYDPRIKDVKDISAGAVGWAATAAATGYFLLILNHI
ncbi:MAG: diacylglycerol kinase family protein [Chlorobi bacterium]|nr:diacylglycerol kinase family protein [Chlorobiota bacterium]